MTLAQQGILAVLETLAQQGMWEPLAIQGQQGKGPLATLARQEI